MKTALITGITGMDGSHLAELLLGKGYAVHGIIRRSSSFNTGRLEPIFQDPHIPGNRLFLHYGDLSDAGTLINLLFKIKPDEIYNLGAQSHVRTSFDIPEYTADITGLGIIRILEGIRMLKEYAGKEAKLYQASSSEMFGATPPPQSEASPFHPRSPYAAAKVFAYHAAVNYREAYGLFIANGILFNHESERRDERFLPRKVARGVARIKAGIDKKLYLGNLEAKRDWGYAPEYVDAMWRMLQQPAPDDFVIGTGESHSVREFVETAFQCAGMPEWEQYVEIDPQYYRPTEVESLIADTRKAKEKLGWEARTKFADLVRIMVDAECKTYGVS